MDANLPPITLVLQNGPDPGQLFPVSDRPQTIGRGTSNDIIIPDKSLSRLHARVRSTPNGYVIEDLGSTNGTFVNERRVTGSAPAKPGDTIRLGSTITLGVQLEGGGRGLGNAVTVVSTAPAALREADPTSLPDATVVRSAPAAQPDQTYVPDASVQPQEQSPNAWLWVGLAVLVVALIVGGILGYLYFSQLPQTPAATEIARAAEIAPPTATSVPTSTPTFEPTLTSTPEPRQVPGLPAAIAQEQALPANIVNEVDPFCEGRIEVEADEPVYVRWSRRLAEADQETDYLAQWLDSAYYDLSLDGRPISRLNYDRSAGPSLNWWHNLGLLSTGTHYLRIQWYTSRPISNGLDVDPTDGQLDTFGPGPAGEGYCEIVVPTARIAAATATPTPTAIPTTPAPTATPEPTKATAQVSVQPAPLGIFQDFESPSTWKRGDQPYGEFARSTGQVRSGSYAGQLSYDFPSANNDYVVFLQSRALAGEPNAISAWVYGDGAGHFLNVWLKDARGQTWGMSFGQVKHTGWQEMTAYIDPSQPWPSGPISGPDNGVIDYPISFQALVLDDGSDNYRGRGTIYIDDLNSQEGVIPSQTGGSTTTGSGSTGSGTSLPYVLKVGSNHRYEPWGAPWDGDACKAYRENRWNDKVQMRAFHLQLLLTNNSTVPIPDGWVPDYRTAAQKTGQFCYFGYGGDRTTAVMPGATGDVTFFTLIEPSDFVQRVLLIIDSSKGQFLEICLDGSGAQVPCQ
jgi:hypothetical protein